MRGKFQKRKVRDRQRRVFADNERKFLERDCPLCGHTLFRHRIGLDGDRYCRQTVGERPQGCMDCEEGGDLVGQMRLLPPVSSEPKETQEQYLRCIVPTWTDTV